MLRPIETVAALAVAVIAGNPAPLLRAQNTLPELPQVSGPFTLEAVTDPVSGKSQFRYHGHDVPPVVRVRPGEDIHIEYINRLSRDSKEKCVMMPCTNGTNLHFHGLHVSPQKPQDDVLTMSAAPGETLRYTVEVPRNQPPGLYWYHTHQRTEWLDTVNVPVQGSVDLVMDFTDPIIRGTSLFHCDLLNHEDKGMMAKIVFR